MIKQTKSLSRKWHRVWTKREQKRKERADAAQESKSKGKPHADDINDWAARSTKNNKYCKNTSSNARNEKNKVLIETRVRVVSSSAFKQSILRQIEEICLQQWLEALKWFDCTNVRRKFIPKLWCRGWKWAITKGCRLGGFKRWGL